MKYIKYSCGCQFEINESNKSLKFDPDIATLPLECYKTWDLISEGNTKGCFQLESRLGRSMSKKLKPKDIEQLSALVSIMRPGCLEAIRNGKSVSNHYIDKKNGEESIDYFHECLKPILESTYGEMVYQEQAMEIAKTVSGFNLQEADMLRKAIGKKQPEEMSKLRSKFIEGAENQKLVNNEQAVEIFNWIEKSQRYSFNKSHAVSYAINAYLSAYAKAHFPKIFFASYLKFAKDKTDPQSEVKELIQNANEMDIVVCTPNLRYLNRFFMIKENKIIFGITDIKGLGESIFNKILQIIDVNNIDINKVSWNEILFKILIKINSSAAKNLISCGALDSFRMNRNRMLFELSLASELTAKEIGHVLDRIDTFKNLETVFKEILLNKVMAKRRTLIEQLIETLKNPPYSLEDSIEWISDSEYGLLGYSITCSKIDMYDITMTNASCKDLKNSTLSKDIITAGEIENINIVKTKNGKDPGAEMAFLTISDSTGVLDSVILFPDHYKQYKNVLFIGNIIIIKGIRAKNKDGLIVEKIYLPKS